jgi:hypothetical protein
MAQTKQASLFLPRGARKVFPAPTSKRKITPGPRPDETILQERRAEQARNIVEGQKKGVPPKREDKKILQRNKDESLQEGIIS